MTVQYEENPAFAVAPTSVYGLQTRYDLERAKDRLGNRLRREVKVLAASGTSAAASRPTAL